MKTINILSHLVAGSRDQDYTYGHNIAFTGKQADQKWTSMHDSLDWPNQQTGLSGLLDSGIRTSKIEYGLFGFTPEDISLSEANPGDRPCASLIYVSSSREPYFPPPCGGARLPYVYQVFGFEFHRNTALP